MLRPTSLDNLAASVVFLAVLLASSNTAGATYRVLYAFSGGSDGSALYGGVRLDAKGDLVGATAGGGNGVGTIYTLTRNPDRTWTKNTIYSLTFPADGGSPNGEIVLDKAGNLYGTTSEGGAHLQGTVFQLSPGPSGWTFTVLHDLSSFSGDVTHTYTGLVISPSGVIYGVGGGGDYQDAAILELAPAGDSWNYTVPFSFGQRADDAGLFYSPMILDAAGNLYGASVGGGNGPPYCSGQSCGTVFKLHPNPDGTWTEHLLHKFAAWKYDGQYATGGVTRDAAGNVYGTTLEGGSHRNGGRCRVGCGTVYKLSQQPNGRWKETILYNFPKDHDGLFPSAGPTLDAAGNLYGTTEEGGDSVCSCGVIYKLSPNPDGSWTYTVLHRFHGTDGRDPAAPLVMDKKGHLYGTTITGGPGGWGVVFRVTP